MGKKPHSLPDSQLAVGGASDGVPASAVVEEWGAADAIKTFTAT